MKLTTIQGHIVLFLKGHYQVPNITTIDGLQRIWAVRCGYGVDSIDKASLEHIADDLYTIFVGMNPNTDLVHFQKMVHREISKDYLQRWTDLSATEKLIMFYSSEIFGTPVREHIGEGKFKPIIKLPTPKVRVFKRILNGNAEFNDYKLIN